MNCEHIKSNKLKYIIENYKIDYIDKTDKMNVYKIGIFNSELIASSQNLYKSLKTYDEIKNIIKEEQETLISTYVKGNKIWMCIETKQKCRYDVNMAAYKRIYNARKIFEKIVENNGHKLLSTYINAKDKVLVDFNCGHESNWLSPNSYLSGTRCPICAGNFIKPYLNDCYTLRKDLLKYFINEEDAIGIAVSNRESKNYKCPICGHIRKNTLGNISVFGFSCPICGDGFSYPEKIMGNVLNELNIKFETHKCFDWCNFIWRDEDHYGVYDFLLSDLNVIIEMDGGFHYKGNKMAKIQPSEMTEIDCIKDKLAQEHGYEVIRIDCNYTSVLDRFEYIKNNIINRLSNILEIRYIDWNIVNKNASTSNMVLTCELWNDGLSVSEITQTLNVNRTSILQYLKNGQKFQMCDYTKEKSYLRRKNKK